MQIFLRFMYYRPRFGNVLYAVYMFVYNDFYLTLCLANYLSSVRIDINIIRSFP